MIPARRTDPPVPAQPAKPSGSGEKGSKPNPNKIQLEYLHSLLGKPISARLLDGKILAGVLTGYDQFCLRLDRAGTPILLYKQAVAYLLPANGKEPADG